ncbi:MAG: PAS domain S-box protein [Candidatus Xenobia bacterium]
MRMLQSLRSSEARFRGLFEQAAVGMYLATQDGRFESVNSQLCHTLGYDPADLLGRSRLDVTHPEDRPADVDWVNRLVAGTVTSAAWEKRYLHRDGESIWCALTLSLLPREVGQPLQMVGIVVDIRERRLAVGQRDRVFALSLDMLCVANFEGVLLEVDPACTTTPGWSAAELTSRPLVDFIHPEDHEATLKWA